MIYLHTTYIYTYTYNMHIYVYIYTTYLANKYGQRWLVKYCYAAKKLPRGTTSATGLVPWDGPLGQVKTSIPSCFLPG